MGSWNCVSIVVLEKQLSGKMFGIADCDVIMRESFRSLRTSWLIKQWCRKEGERGCSPLVVI